MNVDEGTYLLPRGWMDDPIFPREKFTKPLAWTWLIERSIFGPHVMRSGNEMIREGQGTVVTSYRQLEREWQWGRARTRNFLNALVRCNLAEVTFGKGYITIYVIGWQKHQIGRAHV